MKKANFLKENNHILSAGISYTIGKFQVLLNENTNELRIIVCMNNENLRIQPKSDNCVILQSYR